MKLITFLLVLVLLLIVAFDFFADTTQDIIASNGDAAWAPVAQSVYAATSYYLHQYRVAREAYGMQLKLFPKESNHATALFRIARSSERLSDYPLAMKYFRIFLNDFPKHKWADKVKRRLADIEGVYLEFAT